MRSYSREELLQGFAQDFRAAGFPPALEAKAAQVATDSLLRRCQGLVYFRKGRQTKRPRDRQILEAFNGHNHEALALEHGLTVRRIEQIVQAHLKLEGGA